MRNFSAAYALVSILLFLPADTMATCGLVSQVVFHGIGGWFENCPDGHPVAAFAYLLAEPTTTNSNGQDLICESQGPATTGANGPCPTWAGVAGDGIVSIQYDWGVGNQGVLGCPNPTGAGDGNGRLVIHTVANDGSGLVVSVGYYVWLAGYLVEAAHPYEEPVLGSVAPLNCAAPEARSLQILNAATDGAEITAQVEVLPLRIYSDCDPNTVGSLYRDQFSFDSCPEGPAAIPAIDRGNIYTTSGPCPGNGGIGDLRTSAWNFAAAPDGTGLATIVLSEPAGASCAYIGATYRLGGSESPAISGFVAIPASLCADDDGDGISDCEGDCDDSDPAVFPGQTETCNGYDDDCDGGTDEGLGRTTCGVGACERSVDNCSGGMQRDCVPGSPSPEVCDAVDDDCNGVVDDRDDDGDGATICFDCDDGNAAIAPGRLESCNGVDDDCNGLVDDDSYGVDSDGDGILNACDNCRFDDNPAQADTDGDGVGNSCDNCLLAANPAQVDQDDDFRGDPCDNCPTEGNVLQDDGDGDGVGDVCDNCPLRSNSMQTDCDGNGIGDICDSCAPLSDGGLPCGCGPQEIGDIVLSHGGSTPGAFARLSWSTNREQDIEGFNVVLLRGLQREQLNACPIPCEECQTGLGHTYSYLVPARDNALHLMVEIVHLDGRVDLYGPVSRLPMGLIRSRRD